MRLEHLLEDTPPFKFKVGDYISAKPDTDPEGDMAWNIFEVIDNRPGSNKPQSCGPNDVEVWCYQIFPADTNLHIPSYFRQSQAWESANSVVWILGLKTFDLKEIVKHLQEVDAIVRPNSIQPRNAASKLDFIRTYLYLRYPMYRAWIDRELGPFTPTPEPPRQTREEVQAKASELFKS